MLDRRNSCRCLLKLFFYTENQLFAPDFQGVVPDAADLPVHLRQFLIHGGQLTFHFVDIGGKAFYLVLLSVKTALLQHGKQLRDLRVLRQFQLAHFVLPPTIMLSSGFVVIRRYSSVSFGN